VKIITPDKIPVLTGLKNIFIYRSILYTLSIRDIKAKYSQTFLGIFWSVLQPLTGLLIFTIFFSKLIKVDTHGIPYPLFAFTGMIAWYYFIFIVNQGGTSLVDSEYLLRKIYFPRLILPFSKVVVGLVDFGISVILLLVIMIFTGHLPKLALVYFPVFVGLTILSGLSVAVWLSALTIRFRDFQHIIPYLVNFGIWMTPVFYPSTLIPPKYQFILYLNPMAGIIGGLRWCLLGDAPPPVHFIAGTGIMVLVFITGLIYFDRIEHEIVDMI